MSNTTTFPCPLNDFAAGYARESRIEEFISFYCSEEMTGMIIFRFGNTEDAVAVLDAIALRDSVESENYHWEKQEEKGRIGSCEHLMQDVPDTALETIAKHGPRLFEVVADLRAEWGLTYDGHGFDFLTGCNYQEQLALWEAKS